MREGLARFRAKRTCHGVFERSMPSDLIRGWMPVRARKTRQTKGWKRQRPQQGGRYPFVRRLNRNQLV
jgi:hypothetical protein